MQRLACHSITIWKMFFFFFFFIYLFIYLFILFLFTFFFFWKQKYINSAQSSESTTTMIPEISKLCSSYTKKALKKNPDPINSEAILKAFQTAEVVLTVPNIVTETKSSSTFKMFVPNNLITIMKVLSLCWKLVSQETPQSSEMCIVKIDDKMNKYQLQLEILSTNICDCRPNTKCEQEAGTSTSGNERQWKHNYSWRGPSPHNAE